MRTRTTPPPLPDPGSPPKGGRTPLRGIGGRNPLVLLAGGGAVVVLIVAMVRRSAGSSKSSGSTTVPNTYDTTLSDIEAQWENQFEALQRQISGQTQNPAPGTPAAGPPRRQGPHPPQGVTGPVPVRSAAVPAAATGPAIGRTLVRNTVAAPGATPAAFQHAYTASLSTGRR